jgi:hypothetical protein
MAGQDVRVGMAIDQVVDDRLLRIRVTDELEIGRPSLVPKDLTEAVAIRYSPSLLTEMRGSGRSVTVRLRPR